MIGKMIPKLLNKPKVKKLFKKTTNSKTKIKIKTKTKTKKYVSPSKSGLVTSKGLLSKNIKISKKKLLGA
tara:strand:+ start:60 stop:269 length:210 start_codon:yes stop_codon:yes gene_type:complete